MSTVSAQAERQRVVFAIVSSGAVLATLDQFVVNVAFPTISHSLHDSIPALSWVLNGYTIVYAALLVPAGRLADRHGRKGSFLAGVAVFTAASAGCAASSTLAELIAARVIQAAGAALLTPSSLGLLLAASPPQGRAAAVRAWSAVVGASAALGPVVGGLLVTVSWRWIFLVNLPIGIMAIVFGARLAPATAPEGGPLPDFLGAAMIAAGIGALSLGLVNAHDWGWASARTIGTLAAGGILAGAFVRRCGRHPSPVVELSLLRVPRFAVAAASTFVYGVAYSSALLATTVWVQAGWGWSALRFGLAFAVGPLMVPLLAPLVSRVIHRAGAGVTAAIGGAVFTASALIRAFLIGRTPDYPSALLPAVLLTGVGVAFALPTLIGAGSASLPPRRFATGSGVLNMAPQFGYTAGVAVAVAILGSPNPGHTNLVVFHHTWFVTAALGVVMTAIAIQLARHDSSGTAVAASGTAAQDEQRSGSRPASGS